MSFQARVLRIYRSLYKRIFRWGVPFLLIGLYLSASFLYHGITEVYFSRIGLRTLHMILGAFFSLILVLYVYDWMAQWITSARKQPHKPHHNREDSLIDGLFYTMGGITAVLGITIWGISSQDVKGLISYLPHVTIFHHIFAWGFLSIVLIRTYMGLRTWIQDLLAYLREV